MGRDLTLYPKEATKHELKDHLLTLDYKEFSHPLDKDNRSLHFKWFNHDDFKSVDGVYAYISPVSDQKKELTSNKWALHVRNKAAASIFDVKMLNRTLKSAKKKFGGVIEGDYGTNEYVPLWEDNSTPISRGINSVNGYLRNKIKKVRYSLPDPAIELKENQQNENDEPASVVLRQFDPSRVIYNGLVPFAVSMIEFFFSEVFQILINYDENVVKKKDEFKVSFFELLDLNNNQKSAGRIVAESYSFQNLDSINKAYKKWLQIDIRNILAEKKEIGNKEVYLGDKLAEIIEYRHKVVHSFRVDPTLTKKEYQNILDSIEKSIDEVINFLENKYDIETKTY